MLELKFKMRDSDWGDNNSYIECAQNLPIYYDLGEDNIEVIGNFINEALRLAGYCRKNEHIFMESVTEEELLVLADFLEDYRMNKKD